MFPSACSIRSAQCAALIALAAVAGISRFESSTPPETAPTSKNPSLTGTSTRGSSHALRVFFFRQINRLFTTTFEPPNARLSPAIQTHRSRTSAVHSQSPAAISSLIPVPETRVLIACFVFARPVNLTSDAVREHRFPFAVGPPPFAATLPHRADGTPVPMDVSARWSLFAPFVPDPVIPVARLARPEVSGHLLAAPDFFPSSALRGEPAPPLAHLGFRPPLGVSAWGASFHFSFST
jgi:hypothetical protein